VSRTGSRFPLPLDRRHGIVDMSHGGGGRATAQLVEQLFLQHFDDARLHAGNDFAPVAAAGGRLVTSTDGHVVSPLFFPGGDIGTLAVNGTVNDLAMAGAQPHSLTVAFILEEGLALADLDRVAASMGQAARAAASPIVACDTKVVERGKADGLFIVTSGIGVVPAGVDIAGDRAAPGDAILVSGPVGDHGVAIMAGREHLAFETSVVSDCAPLHGLVAALLAAVPGVHCLRDPTRGGLATSLNEIAWQSDVGMLLEETAIPVRPAVRAACEFLGLDPLYVACEGRLLCICPQDAAPLALASLREHPLGREAAIIGRVVEDDDRFVRLRTDFGGDRLLDWLSGEQLPRIC
jgi:hydrogenase expression/formation protein HypE